MRSRFHFWPIAVSLLSCPAISAQNQRIALNYVAEPACPARSEFIAQVRARTRRADFTDDATVEHRFSVLVSGRAGQFVGSLSSPSSDSSTTKRQVSSENCVDVVAALALITALAIDPHADLTEAPARVADEATPPAASAISTAAVPDRGGPSASKVGSAFDAPQPGAPNAARQVVLQRPAGYHRALSATSAPIASNSHGPWRGPVPIPSWLLGVGIEGAFWPSSPGVLWGGLSLLLERQFRAPASLLPALRVNIEHSRSAVHRAGRVLTLLDAYRRDFPQGALQPEAQVLRVEALAGSGQLSRARALAERLLAADPTGPLSHRIRMATPNSDAGATSETNSRSNADAGGISQ